MQLSTGIDLVEIKRIKEILKSPKFLTRFFSNKERELFIQRGYSPSVIAANFAAKEAFSKSLGTGIRGFSLKEISVLRDSLGAPYFELSHRAKEAARTKQFSLSITHTDTTAAAVVIALEKEESFCPQTEGLVEKR